MFFIQIKYWILLNIHNLEFLYRLNFFKKRNIQNDWSMFYKKILFQFLYLLSEKTIFFRTSQLKTDLGLIWSNIWNDKYFCFLEHLIGEDTDLGLIWSNIGHEMITISVSYMQALQHLIGEDTDLCFFRSFQRLKKSITPFSLDDDSGSPYYQQKGAILEVISSIEPLSDKPPIQTNLWSLD